MAVSYRWVIVALGALMSCVAFGAIFSLAVYLAAIAADTGWGRSGVSLAMTIGFLAMGAGAFVWGAAGDRFGPRIVTFAGSLMLVAGLFAASRATSLIAFQLSYGVLVGFACGAFFAPMIAATTGWFDEQRGLAVSLVSVGVGVAPMTMSPLAAWLLETHDWRASMAILSWIALAILAPCSLFVRCPPADPGEGPAVSPVPASQALTSRPFVILAAAFFLCCAAHGGPIFHMISYATFCGVAPMAAVSVYSVEGLAGLGGRVLMGALADRFGSKEVLVGGLVVQALAILGYLVAARLEDFYVLSTVFGAAYGGVMPLYAVLARDHFEQNVMGLVLGGATMMSSLGMALGPVVGGWLFDAFGAYTWLYVASFALGTGAAAVALAFPKAKTAAG